MLDNILNSRTGLIYSILFRSDQTTFDHGFVAADAQLSDTSVFCDWHVEAASAGYGFGANHVFGAMIGETAERYCGNLPQEELILYGSFEDLKKQNFYPVNPEKFIHFSSEQYTDQILPFRKFNINEQNFWVKAKKLDSNLECLVLADLVWPSLSLSLGYQGRSACPPIQAGLAAGRTIEQAVENAVFEIFERDAMHRRGPGDLQRDQRRSG